MWVFKHGRLEIPKLMQKIITEFGLKRFLKLPVTAHCETSQKFDDSSAVPTPADTCAR